MFRWLRNVVRSWREHREQARIIAPHNLRTLADELRELALLTERASPVDTCALFRLRRIRHEMDALVRLTESAEFENLTVEQRLELHESISRAFEQVLDSAYTSPAPTARLQ